MSLNTDAIFLRALTRSEDIAELVGDRIYSTAIPVPEAELDNEPLPYIIVSFDGFQSQDDTKDDEYDSDYDTVQIGVEMAAETRPALARLARLVRKTIRDYFVMLQGATISELDEEDQEVADLLPLSAMPNGGQVNYYDMKPCFWLNLQYACDTKSDLDDEYEEDNSQEPAGE